MEKKSYPSCIPQDIQNTADFLAECEQCQMCYCTAVKYGDKLALLGNSIGAQIFLMKEAFKSMQGFHCVKQLTIQ